MAASILQFRRPELRSGTTRIAGGATADIVFFPGVRYERSSEAPPEPSAHKARRLRRRDRLDLED